MRIGILSLPLHVNYGGILQAYALQTVLERMGHEVKVLSRDKKYRLSLSFWLAKVPSRIVRRALGQKVNILSEFNYNRNLEQIRVNVEPTIDQFVNRDKRYLDEIRKNDYDCIVVGSDQIWRPKYIKDTLRSTIENAFLGFAENWDIKRVAYAASFGTDEWEYTPEQTKKIAHLARMFNSISVREESGMKLCKEHLGVDAIHVLDPTMMLSKEDYINAFNIEAEAKSNGNLMTYILDYTEEKKELVESIAKDKGLTSFTVGAKIDDWKAPIEERIQPRLQTWLRGFYDAEFIVTDSFHACAFSIIFRKPFIVIGNKARGMARFESLLSMFGLEKHLFDANDTQGINMSSIENINWELVDRRLSALRKTSMDFLLNIL